LVLSLLAVVVASFLIAPIIFELQHFWGEISQIRFDRQDSADPDSEKESYSC
jgi:hypothetical protein